ncbi:hypothetical protein P3G55_06935 [Leptospira sp. 96542]|nr:hypothetical protein [Leptospira sp. 96542]
MSGTEDSHNHGWVLVAKQKVGDNFSFHPKLSEWFLNLTSIPKDKELEIFEVSCGDSSCPTEETLFVWEEGGVSQNQAVSKNQFRISRKKENISKMDVDLSWKRFTNK